MNNIPAKPERWFKAMVVISMLLSLGLVSELAQAKSLASKDPVESKDSILKAIKDSQQATVRVVGDTSFSCTYGNVKLELPNRLRQLYRIDRLIARGSGHVLDEQQQSIPHLFLQFKGLELWVLRRADLREGYRLSYASITSPKYPVGPFKVGEKLSGDFLVLQQTGLIPSEGSWQIEGDTDTMVVNFERGVVQSITLDCAEPLP